MKAWGCLFPLRCKACRQKSETCKISEQGFLSHFHLLFKMSVPSPAHSARTSLLPQNPMWVGRSHSCMTPAKLKLNFHLSCQLGRKNRWSWERSLHPHRCPPHGYLSPEAAPSQDLSSMLLSLFLLVSPLPEPSDFTFGHHTGSCQLYNPRMYGVFNDYSQLPYFLPSRA